MYRLDRIGYYRPRGFRISVLDMLVIVFCPFVLWACWSTLGEMALIFPITLGHFFLFCNIFRVRRPFELAWAGLFIANIVIWTLAGHFTWTHVLLVQSPITVAGLVHALRSPWYHGVGCNWTHPEPEAQSMSSTQ